MQFRGIFLQHHKRAVFFTPAVIFIWHRFFCIILLTQENGMLDLHLRTIIGNYMSEKNFDFESLGDSGRCCSKPSQDC